MPPIDEAGAPLRDEDCLTLVPRRECGAWGRSFHDGRLTRQAAWCYFGNTFLHGRTMTSATTIKLPEDLKQRIAPLAEAAGKTAHAWMVEALERQAAMAEAREAFLRDAEASAAEVDAGGALYAAEDVAAYLLSRAAGKAAARPRRAGKSAKATTPASARRRR